MRRPSCYLIHFVVRSVIRYAGFVCTVTALAGSLAFAQESGGPKAPPVPNSKEESSAAEDFPGVDENPVSTDFYEARQLLSKHKWVEAAIVLRSVLRVSPDFLPASVGLATALAYSARREEALGILVRAAGREKGSKHTVLVHRVQVLSRLFMKSDSFQLYQDGLNFLLLKRPRQAREKFEKTLELEPDNVEVLTRDGQALILDGDYDSAAERLRLAKRLNPFEPEVRLWLGRALHHRGEVSDAVVELRAAYGDLEGSELAPLWLSEALQSAGQTNAAIDMLEEDVKIQPNHLSSIVALAKIQIQTLSRDPKLRLGAARKELLLAQSRLPLYYSDDQPHYEGELGLSMREPREEFKLEIDKLLKQVSLRLEE